MPNDTNTTKGQHALILGGGIAGLATAIVLARHFSQVTIVEQDQYGDSETVRPHTAHGDHIHMLLAGGLIALSKIVPDLPKWLDEKGIFEGDLTHHTRVTYRGQWLPQARSNIPIRSCTRSDIEDLLYRQAKMISNLRIKSSCRVHDLLGRVEVGGARVQYQGQTEDIQADLVVDASGRAAIGAKWLKRAGFPPVQEQSLDAGIVYVSSWYRPPSNIKDDWSVIGALPSFPDHPQMPMFMRVRPDRMICSTAIYGRPNPPRNHKEFVEKIATSDNQHLRRLLELSTPISDIAVFGNTQNRMRFFSRVPNFPDGLIILGDAACGLNPRYGQGMTVAAISIETLDDSIQKYFTRHHHLRGFPRHFQRRLEKKAYVPWQTALLEDRAWSKQMNGKSISLGQRIGIRTSQRILDTAFEDIDTYIRFMRVAQMLESPLTMFDPNTLKKIIRGKSHRSLAGPPPEIGSRESTQRSTPTRAKDTRRRNIQLSNLMQKRVE